MQTITELRPWLEAHFAACPETVLHGVCELGDLLPEALRSLPRAVSFAVRMDDALMDSVRGGPTAPYFDEYTRVNALLNALGNAVADRLREAGFQAHRVHSSQRVDFVNIAGEIPHKTAAVLSGLGWIGRNCQLVTRAFGPRVRLCTVLTDMPLGGQPAAVMRSYCGVCLRCVEACPAGALKGGSWTPGLERAALLDAHACDAWKIEHYPQFQSSICGICTSVCPQGTARPRKRKAAGTAV